MLDACLTSDDPFFQFPTYRATILQYIESSPNCWKRFHFWQKTKRRQPRF
jgi:hypothetical protein